jgi:hypothetical protein
MIVHFAIDKYGLSVWAPRTRKIDIVDTFGRSKSAIVEYISIFTILGCCGSTYISSGETAYFTVFEIARCLAKDEIYSAFYVAIFIFLAIAIAIGIESILITKKLTANKVSAIGTYEACDSLSHTSGSVFEREILAIEIVGIYIKTCRS